MAEAAAVVTVAGVAAAMVAEAATVAVTEAAEIETHKAAILAAMQITDELFRERTTARVVEDELRGLGNEVRRWLPPARRGDET